MVVFVAVFCAFFLCGCGAFKSEARTVTPLAPQGMQTVEQMAAQPDSPPPDLALPEEPQVDNKLVPGDRISIQVYDQPSLSMELYIPMSGQVSYPMIGSVQLAGRTVEEVEADLKSRLQQHVLRQADVTVLVKEYNKRMVHLLGMVKTPGAFEIQFGKRMTFLQALTLGGGFESDADKDNVLLVREAGGKRTAYRLAYRGLLKEDGLKKDVGLQDGDIIIVPERGKAYVLGKVNSPGSFSVPSDHKITLTKIISLAGGFAPLASQGRTTLIRTPSDGNTRIFQVNVTEIFNGTLADPVVLPNDVIFVPESFF